MRGRGREREREIERESERKGEGESEREREPEREREREREREICFLPQAPTLPLKQYRSNLGDDLHFTFIIQLLNFKKLGFQSAAGSLKLQHESKI